MCWWSVPDHWLLIYFGLYARSMLGAIYIFSITIHNVDKCAKYVIHYSQSFVYCRVFVLLIIDYSTKKDVLVYWRKCSSEIVYFRSNPYRKQCELMW